MKRLPCLLLLAAASVFSSPASAAPPEPVGTAYIKQENGWVGFWPHGGEFLQFALEEGTQMQDGYHALLTPRLAMMMTFADKKKFGGGDMLQAHRKWELDYWRESSGSAEGKDRSDLAEGRAGVMVTELILPQQKGEALHAYIIGVAGNDGVYVFAVSPVTAADDALVRKLIASIRLLHQELDIAAEAKRIKNQPAPEVKAKP
jgi:hypothetical protein